MVVATVEFNLRAVAPLHPVINSSSVSGGWNGGGGEGGLLQSMQEVYTQSLTLAGMREGGGVRWK